MGQAWDFTAGYDEVILQERIRVTFLPVLSSYFLDSYGRFLDDINFRWNRQWLRELESIKNIMNSIDHYIKYEYESSQDSDDNSIALLDVRVIVKYEYVITD